jgi:transposase
VKARAYINRESSGRLKAKLLSVLAHTLHKKTQFATTFCDLGNRRVFDVVPGKSAPDLEDFLSRLKGREKLKMICIDLC